MCCRRMFSDLLDQDAVKRGRCWRFRTLSGIPVCRAYLTFDHSAILGMCRPLLTAADKYGVPELQTAL